MTLELKFMQQNFDKYGCVNECLHFALSAIIINFFKQAVKKFLSNEKIFFSAYSWVNITLVTPPLKQ